MSDLDQLRAMLDRAGILYEEGDDLWSDLVAPPREAQNLDASWTLRVSGSRYGTERNLGFSAFFTDAYFTEDGSLIAWGTWE
jgi:hypothetical protein